jgi:hypothetical protein
MSHRATLVPNGITSSAVRTAFQQDLQQIFPAYRALKGWELAVYGVTEQGSSPMGTISKCKGY